MRRENLVARQAALGQQLRGGGAARLGRDGDEQVLGADVLVLQPFRFGLGEIGDELEPGRQAGLRAAVGLGNLAEQLARGPRDLGRVGRHLPQHLGHDALALFDERDEQMLGLDLRVARLLGELLRREHRFLGFFGVFVDIHDLSSSQLSASASLVQLRCPSITVQTLLEALTVTLIAEL